MISCHLGHYSNNSLLKSNPWLVHVGLLANNASKHYWFMLAESFEKSDIFAVLVQ
jgi:hypothetical protein